VFRGGYVLCNITLKPWDKQEAAGSNHRVRRKVLSMLLVI